MTWLGRALAELAAPGPGQLPALDGLRALAILLVVARHVTRMVVPDGATPAALAWAKNGWAGVDLFFVLSGFLIARQLLRTSRGELGGLRGYLVRRGLRIVPAYWVWVLVLAAGLVPCDALHTGDLLRSVVVHLLFLQDVLGSDLLVTFWSLGVEEKLYLLAPLLLLGLARLPGVGARAAVVAALALVPAALRLALYRSDPEGLAAYDAWFVTLRSPVWCSADGFLLGLGVALLLDAPERRAHWAGGRWPAVALATGATLVALLLLPAERLDRVDALEAGFLPLGLSLGFALVLAGLVLTPDGLCSRALGGRALRVVARLSYAWYLVHFAFVNTVWVGVDQAVGLSGRPPAVQLALYAPAFVAVTLAWALLLHLAVERPFLVLRARLASAVPVTSA